MLAYIKLKICLHTLNETCAKYEDDDLRTKTAGRFLFTKFTKSLLEGLQKQKLFESRPELRISSVRRQGFQGLCVRKDENTSRVRIR